MREGNQSLPCYDMGKNHFSRHEVRAMPRPAASSSMGAVLSEQIAEMREQVAELRAETREQNAALRADIALLLAASRN